MSQGTEARKKTSKMGIRARLIAVIIPIVFVIIISFFALSRNAIVKLSKEKIEAESKVCASNIYAWTDRIFGELQVYQDTIEEGGFQNDAEILKYMETSVDKNTAYPVGLYMGDDKGVYLDASGWVPDADWVLTERDWYLDGKDKEKLTFGEPYYDSQSGDVCVSAVVRVDYPGAVRVLAADIYLDYVSGLVSEIDGEGGIRSFLVTGESQTLIAHPDTRLVAVTLDAAGLDQMYGNVGAAISAGKRGLLDVQGDDGAYVVCINEIPNTDWLLVSYMSRNDVLADLTRLEIIMVVIAVLAALVLIVVTLHLMNRVVKPVAQVTDVIQKVSEGDFSQNIEVKGNDEIARMGVQTQNFLVKMRETIAGITETARWLERQSVENDKVSGSLMESSENQADAMRALNNMVDEFSRSAERVSAQMTQLAEMVQKADMQGKNADGIMRQTVEISGDGQVAAEQVNEGMRHIETSISSLAEQIMQTDAAIEQIGSMVEMIVNVADETNLLSLNASIEAARAGESGRGFAIVAAQIAKLAESSSVAADDISSLTAEIRGAMQQAIVKMEESVAEVKNSAVLVGKNKETFATMFKKVNDANEVVGQMAELVGRVGKVAADMQEVAEGQVVEAGQIKESVDQLDGYTKAVNDDSGIVSQSAKELERESRQLMERVSGFCI